MGFFSQVRIDFNERAYLISNNPVIMCGGIVCIILAIMLFCRIAQKNVLTPNIVFGIVLVLGMFWIMISQNIPSDDSEHCLRIAEELADGITHSFDAGQYMDTCRQQFGLVLYMYVLTLIGGSYNHLLFQAINALLVALMCRESYAYICEYNIGESENPAQIANLSLLLFIIYVPFWMSVSYVYGNIPGLALAVIAVIFELRFLKTDRRKYAVWAMLLIAISIALKMFYLIFLIAMIIIYIWNFIEQKKAAKLIWAVATIAAYIVVSLLVSAVINGISGGLVRENGGYSLFGTMAMGLNLDEEQTNPGWYDAYNVESYYESGYDKSQADIVCKEKLGQIFDNACDNPVSYIKLFVRKNHTVWNEATFDVFYRNRITEASELSSHAGWYDALITDSGRLHRVILLLLDCLQVVIYFGAIIFCISSAGRKKYTDLIGLIVFIGGVLFISIWEAKSEYALCYFLPLLVYSARGYDILYKLISQKNIKALLAKNSIVGGCVAALSVVLSLVLMPHFNDEEQWNTYINEHYYISAGDYTLVSLGSGESVHPGLYVEYSPVFETNWAYVFYDNSSRAYFTFKNWDEIDRSAFDRMMATADETVQVADTNEAGDRYYDDHWVVERSNGGYLIRWFANQNKVWTWDRDAQTIRLLDYAEGDLNQIWELK